MLISNISKRNEDIELNILYCGDQNIEEGLMISVLSLLRTSGQQLNIYVLTMRFRGSQKEYVPVTDHVIDLLDGEVRKVNSGSFVRKVDVSELFARNIPAANLQTRFTPCCMLRLYADQIPELPDRILYLDNDVICRQDISAFYEQDMEGKELAGVLDYYGSWFFRQVFWKRDYLNSGVLLLNLRQIRQTGLFERCRQRCRTRKMFMPDQSAINKLAVRKVIAPRKYNEQRVLRKDTVMQHFTTSFRFFPWLHAVSVKPWDVERVHSVLKLHEYDDLLEQYISLAGRRIPI